MSEQATCHEWAVDDDGKPYWVSEVGWGWTEGYCPTCGTRLNADEATSDKSANAHHQRQITYGACADALAAALDGGAE